MSVINPYTTMLPNLDAVADLSKWGKPAIEILRETMICDPGHDEGHILRVVRGALLFGAGGDLDVIVPAAILHDLVNVPKDSPDRNKASWFSARKALEELTNRGLPTDTDSAANIFHSIQAHSWSAKVEPLTIEAKAIQDADRIESLGCIGLTRMFAVGGAMGRTLFHPTDPLATNRELDEETYGLDHYFVKLNTLASTMQTSTGKLVAEYHTRKMDAFIKELVSEITG